METRRWSRKLLKAEHAREYQRLLELQGERDGLEAKLSIVNKEYETLYRELYENKGDVPDYVEDLLFYWGERRIALARQYTKAKEDAANVLATVEDLTTFIEELDKVIEEEDNATPEVKNGN